MTIPLILVMFLIFFPDIDPRSSLTLLAKFGLFHSVNNTTFVFLPDLMSFSLRMYGIGIGKMVRDVGELPLTFQRDIRGKRHAQRQWQVGHALKPERLLHYLTR